MVWNLVLLRLFDYRDLDKPNPYEQTQYNVNVSCRPFWVAVPKRLRELLLG
jgi:hypothetical protein